MDSDDYTPSICEECLSSSFNIRMTRVPNGAKCRICTLSFTLYHFKKDERSSVIIKTNICHRCSEQRHVCQCCLMDLTWGISIKERDEILSIVNGSDFKTVEAKNDMMKKFLTLKKDAKLGGAKITSDSAELSKMMEKLEEVLKSKDELYLKKGKTNKIRDNDGFQNVDISHILKKLPLKESFTKTGNPSTSFLLYNVDASIPEWKISEKISQIVNEKEWKHVGSKSLIINHKAKVGGIRFKNDELSTKFTDELISNEDYLIVKKGGNGNLQRGILKIGHFQIFVIPWSSGFSVSSFGNNVRENMKLALSFQKLISNEVNLHNGDDRHQAKKENLKKINKITKKSNKKNARRIASLEL
ncbi:hypothetical protein KAFR_0C00480 [Kazachstania africana CBS 2517]|uniref:Pre-mRNA-splicing factor SLT11 n=1 Tax=Kazachstania africana (strain ATCC 22294 / BCRC 22015 / CBS 2517 / CECT 1963 / NBRC 1671 / NRRL Y-8276) TaxID=1071382 RepID=H2ARP3_KAZAF|nr:hypothetical protein KAFR_0C00480 [Kazachstania africana CBS 2517]CCF57043.1 hypothetical protein KAFR_0C00480 [Kazachstania africana CBS 2517]